MSLILTRLTFAYSSSSWLACAVKPRVHKADSTRASCSRLRSCLKRLNTSNATWKVRTARAISVSLGSSNACLEPSFLLSARSRSPVFSSSSFTFTSSLSSSSSPSTQPSGVGSLNEDPGLCCSHHASTHQSRRVRSPGITFGSEMATSFSSRNSIRFSRAFRDIVETSVFLSFCFPSSSSSSSFAGSPDAGAKLIPSSSSSRRFFSASLSFGVRRILRAAAM
mmetsp:Transcript_27093/g.65862  ORF Transcript_27093/g.65862 Transcript_27093/m.65862 type:complete len:223 (+) Transcript_27093:3892-4560(+)